MKNNGDSRLIAKRNFTTSTNLSLPSLHWSEVLDFTSTLIESQGPTYICEVWDL